MKRFGNRLPADPHWAWLAWNALWTSFAGFCLAIIFGLLSLFHFVGSIGGLLVAQRPKSFGKASAFAVSASIGVQIIANVCVGAPFRDSFAAHFLVAATGLVIVTHVVSKLFFCPRRTSGLVAFIESSQVHVWFARRLRHDVDAIWFPRAILASMLAGSLLVAIAIGECQIYALAVVYVYLVGLTNGHIDAFEHACGHYRFLERPAEGLKGDRALWAIRSYCRYVLPVLLGRIPFWYEVEHNAVHHAEDNGIEDLQTTVRYDRASAFDYIRCVMRFVLNGILSIEVLAYLVTKRRRKAVRKVVLGLTIFYGTVVVVAMLSPLAAGAMILARVVGLGLSATSFFREHGMVDIDQPANVYRNSLTFLDPECDHGGLGDDLHVEHHLRPSDHWSKYVASLQSNVSRYEGEAALGFVSAGGGIRAYYAALWARDFSELAQHFVLVGSVEARDEEIAALLRDRVRPLHPRRPAPFADLLDRQAGAILSRLIPRFVD